MRCMSCRRHFDFALWGYFCGDGNNKNLSFVVRYKNIAGGIAKNQFRRLRNTDAELEHHGFYGILLESDTCFRKNGIKNCEMLAPGNKSTVLVPLFTSLQSCYSLKTFLNYVKAVNECCRQTMLRFACRLHYESPCRFSVQF